MDVISLDTTVKTSLGSCGPSLRKCLESRRRPRSARALEESEGPMKLAPEMARLDHIAPTVSKTVSQLATACRGDRVSMPALSLKRGRCGFRRLRRHLARPPPLLEPLHHDVEGRHKQDR